MSKQLRSSLLDPPKYYSDKAWMMEGGDGRTDSAGIKEGARDVCLN